MTTPLPPGHPDHLTYDENERNKGGRERNMHRAFWTTMQLAIVAFAFSVFIAPSSHAPILIGGVAIEPIILMIALVLCPIFYVIGCLRDRDSHFDWAITYAAFFLFVYIAFPYLFAIWLNVSFSPRNGYVWQEGVAGTYSYVPNRDMAAGDMVHVKHAVVSPPAIDPP